MTENEATMTFPSIIAWLAVSGRDRIMLLMRYLVWATVVFLLAAIGAAQETPRTVNPREFGLDLPPGAVMPGERQAVTTTDDDGQPVVGRIHARIGKAAVILLPDGELVGRNEGQFSPTDRKFERLDKDK